MKSLDVIHSFEKTMKTDKTIVLKKHDLSELALFEARNYEAMGNLAKAIEILQRKDLVVNRTAKNEALARIYTTLGNKDKAISHYE